MYDRILLPTDGSECAARAADHAIELATRYDADLLVLSVVNPASLGPDVRATAILEELEARAEEHVEAVVAEAVEQGVPSATGEVRRGTPHSVILEFVADHDVDVVVMGTHGRTGLDRYLLGSVTERVVRSADVPVLTVRQPDRGD
jgi:nucleotide-binding universal stress UspA family protein